jgi:hypothetical protein
MMDAVRSKKAPIMSSREIEGFDRLLRRVCEGFSSDTFGKLDGKRKRIMAAETLTTGGLVQSDPNQYDVRVDENTSMAQLI